MNWSRLTVDINDSFPKHLTGNLSCRCVIGPRGGLLRSVSGSPLPHFGAHAEFTWLITSTACCRFHLWAITVDAEQVTAHLLLP